MREENHFRSKARPAQRADAVGPCGETNFRIGSFLFETHNEKKLQKITETLWQIFFHGSGS